MTDPVAVIAPEVEAMVPEIVQEPAQEIIPEVVPEPVAPPAEDNHDTRRMKKYIREAYEAKAEVEALRAQLANTSRPAQNQEPTGEPRKDQFPDAESYFRAVAVYEVNKAKQEIKRELQGQVQLGTFKEKVKTAMQEIPDYEETVRDSDVRFTPDIQDVIMSSPLSAYVAYELAKDPDAAERIATLPPAHAAREIGRIEAKIEAARAKPKTAAPAQKPVSAAPAPIKPVATKSEPAPIKPKNDSDWLRLRRAEKYKLTSKR